MRNKIIPVILIGVIAYFFFSRKKQISIRSKVGSRLRKFASINSEILKTFSKEIELKLIMIKKENDGNWYLIQELFPAGSKGSSGEDIGGNVMWTGFIREDALNFIK